ncbi:MAG TPA: STAS domain-containing protein [Catenuloplanes sp.]|jgi:anti-anti-sigma factor
MSNVSVPVRQTDPYRQPHMSLQLTTSGAVAVVKVTGEVDADNAHLIPELVDCLPAHQLQRLVLDLVEVTFICAAGAHALVRVRETVTVAAGQLIVRDPSPVVLTVLAGCRVIQAFQIHRTQTRRPAVPALTPPGRSAAQR